MQRIKIIHSFYLLIVLASLSGTYTPKTISGKVYKVVDGDTVHILYKSRVYKIRLSHIDAPETKQLSYDGKKIGEMATKYLQSLLPKRVSVRLYEKDRYGRFIGEFFHQGKSINLEMVKAGMAMVYPRVTVGTKKQYARYKAFQQVAKLKFIGLWNVYGFDYPWKWRRKN
jgi:micrococcal nuclease